MTEVGGEARASRSTTSTLGDEAFQSCRSRAMRSTTAAARAMASAAASAAPSMPLCRQKKRGRVTGTDA